MKPRIEKKLSKKLVAIFEGTRQFDSVWIDNEYYRETPAGTRQAQPSSSVSGVVVGAVVTRLASLFYQNRRAAH